MGGLTTGLVWLSFLDGLEVSLLSAFVHCQSLGLSFGCTSGEVFGLLYSGLYFLL